MLSKNKFTVLVFCTLCLHVRCTYIKYWAVLFHVRHWILKTPQIILWAWIWLYYIFTMSVLFCIFLHLLWTHCNNLIIFFCFVFGSFLTPRVLHQILRESCSSSSPFILDTSSAFSWHSSGPVMCLHALTPLPTTCAYPSDTCAITQP